MTTQNETQIGADVFVTNMTKEEEHLVQTYYNAVTRPLRARIIKDLRSKGLYNVSDFDEATTDAKGRLQRDVAERGDSVSDMRIWSALIRVENSVGNLVIAWRAVRESGVAESTWIYG